MARTTYSAGPGVVVLSTTVAPTVAVSTFWSKDDIMITEDLDSIDLNSSAFGKLDSFAKDRKVEISFTPLPLTTYIPALFPYVGATSHKVGDKIYPADDIVLTVIGLDGSSRAYKASALTKMPSLNFGMDKDLFGPVTFTCLGAGDTDWVTANSLNTLTASSIDWDARSLDIDLLTIQQSYASAAWGTTPWDAFTTVDGISVDLNLALTPMGSDRYGVQNMMISGLEVSCSFAPNGITEAQIAAKHKMQGTGVNRGGRISTLGSATNLVITQGTAAPVITATIYGAAVKSVDYSYSQTKARIATVKAVATRTSFTGYLSNLFSISATAHA